MALTRCSKCGNLVSDKASACPICGHEVSAAAATTAPASTPKTLNDILAERGAVPETLNDRLQREAAASTAPAAEADAPAALRSRQQSGMLRRSRFRRNRPRHPLLRQPPHPRGRHRAQRSLSYPTHVLPTADMHRMPARPQRSRGAVTTMTTRATTTSAAAARLWATA